MDHAVIAKRPAAAARQPAAPVRAAAWIVRPRLKLGGANDEAERHADRVAAKALAAPGRTVQAAGASIPRAASASALPGSVSRAHARAGARHGVGHAAGSTPAADTAGDEAIADLAREMAAARAWDDAAATPLPPSLSARIAALQGAGEPLPATARADMEARFGVDFSAVRVHDGAEANALAAELDAHAFTVGEHIVFDRGALAPRSVRGRELLAHELAHVTQQRAVQGRLAAVDGPVRRDALDVVGSVVDGAGNFLADRGLDVVERFSPRLAEILRHGPIQWLREQAVRAFDGLVGALNHADPRAPLGQMSRIFAALLVRGRSVVSALVDGDCEPLLQAIRELKTFLVDVASSAWDKLTDFLRPVGDFFSRLWAGYGAPAVRWLQQEAGEFWEGLQQLGRDIWHETQGVRHGFEQVWNWVKGELFGPDDGGSNSSEGLVGWISRKAGEAWDWLKQRTQPIWRPVADAAQRVAALIPPPFMAHLAEQMQDLGGQLDQTAGRMESDGAGRSIAHNRAALANALPAVTRIIGGVRGMLVGAGRWLVGQVGGLAEGITSLMGRLRANQLTALIANAIGWLAAAADDALGWARDQVAALFESLAQGFDRLVPFFERVLDAIRGLIGVVGNLMTLPALILGAVWNAIPACIRDPIKDFLVNQILGRIPVFGQFFTDPALWPRVQRKALEILAQVFVDGHLARAAWTFFCDVLEVLGVPPQLVVRIIAKAARAIGDVLRDPIGFLGNLLGAMRLGFRNFFSNFGTHLLDGLTGWLFGAAEEAGVRPPADLSFRSILGFVLEVLGVTVDHVFQRLAVRVGPTVAARLRTMLGVATGVWGFVSTLVEEGPAGLWRELQQRVSDLWNQVVEGVTGWITERIVAAATRWLMSLLDVTGIMPVINALVAIYEAIESFFQYVRQLLEIVSNVLDGVLEIAHGQLERAGQILEDSLGRALPVVIGFLANQFGFGRIAQRLGELLARARGAVEGAIDWLIERAIRLGQALLDMARRGVAAVRNWWAARVDFRLPNGEQHHLHFDGDTAHAGLVVESTPEPFEQFLARQPPGPDKDEAQRLYLLLRVKQDHAVTAGAAQGGPRHSQDATGATAPNLAVEIQSVMEQLSVATARLMAGGAAGNARPEWAPVSGGGYGTDVSVPAITKAALQVWPHGGPPGGGTESWPGWRRLVKRRNDATGNSSYYVRGHLLNHNIGGPGTDWNNLTPLAQETNNRGLESMLHSFEGPVKAAVDETKTVRNFHVRPDYGGTSRAAQLASIAAEIDVVDGKSTRPRVSTLDRAHLATIRDVIDEEQHIPSTITCSAVIEGANDSRRALNAVIDNRPTLTGGDDWARYRVNP